MGSLRPHSGLLQGEIIEEICITNSITMMNDAPKKMVFNVQNNMTLWELKRQIAIKTNTPPQYVNIIRQADSRTLKEIDNGKTLLELGFKSKETPMATKKPSNNIPKSNLLDKDNNMVPRLVEIFDKWFKRYSNDEGHMLPVHCAQFIRSCTDDNCRPED